MLEFYIDIALDLFRHIVESFETLSEFEDLDSDSDSGKYNDEPRGGGTLITSYLYFHFRPWSRS